MSFFNTIVEWIVAKDNQYLTALEIQRQQIITVFFHQFDSHLSNSESILSKRIKSSNPGDIISLDTLDDTMNILELTR